MLAKSLLCTLFLLVCESAQASSLAHHWRVVVQRVAGPEEVGELFRSVLRDQAIQMDGHSRWSEASWNKERYYDLREPGGDGFTRWYFTRPEKPEDFPVAAVKVRIAKHPPYMAQAIIFCKGETCEPLFERVSDMPPPAPDLDADPELRSSWMRTIYVEPCTRRTPALATEKYPAEELKRGIVGRVELRLVTNSCGDVRAAFTTKSSGNRGLDRAARRQALSWRLPAPAGEEGKREWASWVEFSTGDDPVRESVTTGKPSPVPSPKP